MVGTTQMERQQGTARRLVDVSGARMARLLMRAMAALGDADDGALAADARAAEAEVEHINQRMEWALVIERAYLAMTPEERETDEGERLRGDWLLLTGRTPC